MHRAAHCRKPGERPAVRFQLEEAFEWDLCSADPWLVLHKIDAPTKMRYVGARFASCSSSSSMNAGGAHSANAADAWLLPGSIEPYVSADSRAYWAQRREAALKQQQQQQPASPPPPPQQQQQAPQAQQLSSVASEQSEQQQLAGGGPAPPMPGSVAAAGSNTDVVHDSAATEIDYSGKQATIRV